MLFQDLLPKFLKIFKLLCRLIDMCNNLYFDKRNFISYLSNLYENILNLTI